MATLQITILLRRFNINKSLLNGPLISKIDKYANNQIKKDKGTMVKQRQLYLTYGMDYLIMLTSFEISS